MEMSKIITISLKTGTAIAVSAVVVVPSLVGTHSGRVLVLQSLIFAPEICSVCICTISESSFRPQVAPWNSSGWPGNTSMLTTCWPRDPQTCSTHWGWHMELAKLPLLSHIILEGRDVGYSYSALLSLYHLYVALYHMIIFGIVSRNFNYVVS